MVQYLIQMTHKFGVPVVREMTEKQANQFDKLLDECYPEGTGRGFIIKLPSFPNYLLSELREKNCTRKELENLLIPIMPGGNTLASYDAVVDHFYNLMYL